MCLHVNKVQMFPTAYITEMRMIISGTVQQYAYSKPLMYHFMMHQMRLSFISLMKKEDPFSLRANIMSSYRESLCMEIFKWGFSNEQ